MSNLGMKCTYFRIENPEIPQKAKTFTFRLSLHASITLIAPHTFPIEQDELVWWAIP